MDRRLTTRTPQNNFENLMNYAYAKDKVAHLRYAGGKENIPLHEYVASLCEEKGCKFTPEEVMEDGLTDCEDCPIAVLYTLGCQAAENNARLMKYEDSNPSLTD